MEDFLKTDIATALKRFALGNQIQCKVENSIWTFDLTKNNATVIMNPRMIQFGEWYVKFD